MNRIIVNNHTCRLLAPESVKMQLRDVFAIKNKNAWWSPAYHQGRWDGYVRYITEAGGVFKTGLLQQCIKHLEVMGKKFEIEDNRETFKDLHEPKELGGLEFRGYQFEAVRAVLNNKYLGMTWQRGILHEATNAGKSLIAAGIFASFANKRKGLVLINNKVIFNQLYPDLCKLLGKENVGRVNAEHVEWKRVNICMAQTLGNRLKKDPQYKNNLAKVDIVVVDECDEVMGRKDAQNILNCCYNATVRIGMSGTIGLHKDPLRNQEVMAFFGPVIHVTTNKQLVDMGVSARPDIRMTLGNTTVREDGDYDAEYNKGIIRNKKRHRRIWARVRLHIKHKRLPLIILFRHHEHARRIMDQCPEDIADKYRIKTIHGKVKNRESILDNYNKGKVDILLASMIIKRGKNLPLTKVLVNAVGGDSEVIVVQVLGRLVRSHKSKEYVVMDEFYDIGQYLQRHSKHRLRYYKKQGFKVRELFKEKLKGLTIK